MRIPSSPHFTPISLVGTFNADRMQFDGGLSPRMGDSPDWSATAHGERSYRGIPFVLGQPDETNVVLLDGVTAPDGVRIDTEPFLATYLVFLHAVEDAPLSALTGFADLAPGPTWLAGNDLGDHVADYGLIFADGDKQITPILRRFAIQQRHITWGASPFAAAPATSPMVLTTASEDADLGRAAHAAAGQTETRHESGRAGYGGENLWLYALPNPSPERPIQAITLCPRSERAVIYGISATTVTDHPLRPGVRRKLRLTLPPGAMLNAIGELDTDARSPTIGIDLGTVISARAALDYDPDKWLGADPDAQPAPAADAVVVEYAAHPRGRLHIATGAETAVAVDLPNEDGTAAGAGGPGRIVSVAPADRPVRLRVLDGATRQPVSVRLHLHGEGGEYLPPQGRHRKVNPYWFEDNYGEFVNGHNQYAYIDGECVVDLPLGRVWVEITRGYEILPIRTVVEITPETTELTFELERRLPWRERGWVTADTHVHFLSPQTALLEGQAEGVNVVNLLASQWGEMYSNVSDFDGRTTLGAREFGGDGEFLVRVGTENRMHVLGHISLLGYQGPMITPLCTGGPAESAIGDPQAVSMAEWAERCIAQQGLVVMPHAPNPQCERAADIVLGLVHAIELMTFNPHDNQLSAHGLADWYRYQNLGYQVPLCGGSDKMSAASLLGGVRTYAHLGAKEFSFPHWQDAVRAGNTFVTVGPLIEFAVEGLPAGQRLSLPNGGGTVNVTWRVESVRLPIARVEVIAGGRVVGETEVGGTLAASGNAAISVTESTWIALRVRGSLRGREGDIAAHTSSVQVLVGDRPLFIETDAIAVIEQIEGALAYVDTLAPRPEERRFKELRATLESAHRRLHARLHRQGVDHRHTPLHRHDDPREH